MTDGLSSRRKDFNNLYRLNVESWNITFIFCDMMTSSNGNIFHVTSCFVTWWRHQMETFSELLAICAGNSPVPGEFPAQRPVTRSFGVFFDLRLNKWLRKQSWGLWFETLSRPLWRHCNELYSAREGQILSKLNFIVWFPLIRSSVRCWNRIWPVCCGNL